MITNENLRSIIEIYCEQGKDSIHLGIHQGKDINLWDVSNITDMSKMFKDINIDITKHPYSINLSKWNVSNVTNMKSMFDNCKLFKSDLSKWNVSNVTNMESMFDNCKNFKSDLSKWNVSNVKNMDAMFYNCQTFESNLSGWNVSNVENMQAMFYNCTIFRSNLSNWKVENVQNMKDMFYNCINFRCDLSRWNVSNVQNMQSMFYNCTIFTSLLSRWNVLNVQNMESMFYNCTIFTSGLSNWKVENVQNMKDMFYNCRNFTSVLSGWNVSNVENMQAMFYNCTNLNFTSGLSRMNVFTSDLSKWNVSKVQNMEAMFYNCTNFTSNLSNWKVENVQNMKTMFFNCTNFTSDLSRWNVSNVKNIEAMFFNCTNFTSDLSEWNIENVENMKNMLFACKDTVKFTKIPTNVDIGEDLITWIEPILEQQNILRDSIRNQSISSIIRSNTTNPYLISYEVFNGIEYPVITIPKGTLLFNGRRIKTEDPHESFNFLYKMNLAKLDYYNDFEKTFTFFFPIPYMISHVVDNIKTIDIVVSTCDIKLLCLMNPSPMKRSDKGKIPDTGINICKERIYDLCMTKDLLYGLKLNGYIGMPVMDSVSIRFETIKYEFEKKSHRFEDTKLLKSCVFQNDSRSIFQTFGIPEICIIPYNIHKEHAETQYEDIKDQMSARKFNFDNDDTFIFKPYKQEDTLEKIDEFLILKRDEICYSMQSYLLFYSLRREIDPDLLRNGMMIPLTEIDSRNHSVDELNIINSYMPKSDSPPCFTAFENVIMYDKMKRENVMGGRKNKNVLDSVKTFPRKMVSKFTMQPSKIIIKTKNMYYSERSGIPVFMIKNVEPTHDANYSEPTQDTNYSEPTPHTNYSGGKQKQTCKKIQIHNNTKKQKKYYVRHTRRNNFVKKSFMNKMKKFNKKQNK